MTIKAPKDFWAGMMFLAIAAIAVLAARGYSFGTATKMGPGYFPMVLGLVLGALGLVLIVRSVVVTGEAIEELHVRPLGTLMVAIVAFGLLLPHLGLAVSLALVTFLSACANKDVRLLEAAALSAGMTALSIAIFVYGLRLALPLWPSF